MDYRVILRRFEYERLMVPREGQKLFLGQPFLHVLISTIDRPKFGEYPPEFDHLTEAQQLLYRLWHFDFTIGHGFVTFFGLQSRSQWIGVLRAIKTLGLTEFADQYEQLLAIAAECESIHGRNFDLLMALGKRLQGEGRSNEVEKWYRDSQRALLDQKVRGYQLDRINQLVRFCEQDSSLEIRWIRERVFRLITEFDWLIAYRCHENLGGNDDTFRESYLRSLFLPEIRPLLTNTEIPIETLSSVFDSVRSNSQSLNLASYLDTPSPRILIRGESSGGITLSYYEDQYFAPHWGISEWN